MTTKQKPQTCVWQRKPGCWLGIGCRASWIDPNCIKGPHGWRFCPWCGKQIKVEKARTR